MVRGSQMCQREDLKKKIQLLESQRARELVGQENMSYNSIGNIKAESNKAWKFPLDSFHCYWAPKNPTIFQYKSYK